MKNITGLAAGNMGSRTKLAGEMLVVQQIKCGSHAANLLALALQLLKGVSALVKGPLGVHFRERQLRAAPPQRDA